MLPPGWNDVRIFAPRVGGAPRGWYVVVRTQHPSIPLPNDR